MSAKHAVKGLRRVFFPQVPLVVQPAGNRVAQQGVISFVTAPNQNKIDIKNYLSKVYGLGVIKVNTLNYDGKIKGNRKHQKYRRKNWKKVVATIDNTDFLNLLQYNEEPTDAEKA